MPSGTRLQRIADRMRQELSEMLIREISDPRLQQIYVTDVKIDKELAFADVYVSAIEVSHAPRTFLPDLNLLPVSSSGHSPHALNCAPFRVSVFTGI